jgi:phosphopantothenoylcysteine decarboxylase/phosphopantothenate--cysteine ligase
MPAHIKLRHATPSFVLMDDSSAMTSPAAARSISRVVLGLTGGIAAYKAAELTRLLVKEGIAVDVVMPNAAAQFIAPMTCRRCRGTRCCRPVGVGRRHAMGHRAVTPCRCDRRAPASADFIAKLANGHADDLLSTLVSPATARC